MNLLEHHIKEIYSEVDITDKYIKRTGRVPKERMLEINLKINCYGKISDKKIIMSESEWESVKDVGYYLA